MRRAPAALFAVGALALVPDAPAQEPSRNVVGYVYSAGDSTPLPDVRVRPVAFPRLAATDAAGRFQLFNLPLRPITLLFERIGVSADSVTLGPFDTLVVVHLALAPVRLSPVEAQRATEARRRFEVIAQTSTVTLDPLDITNTPALAEPDVARTVQLLPGTVAKHDFYVGFNVRGGEADQNLIQVDGVPVFNPSHVGGLFSTFDPNALDRVTYLTGGFPARYGGRLSSVLDVEVRPGSRHDTRLAGQVSLLSSKLLVEGPIGATGISYLVSGRRSYIDLLAAAFVPDGVPYYFGDVLGKVVTPLPTGGSLALTGYWGRDALDWEFIEDQPDREGIDLEFSWGNRLAGMAIQHRVGAVELEQRLSASAFSTTLALVPDIRFLTNEARVYSASASAAVTDGGANYVRVGGGVDAYRMAYSEGSSALATTSIDLDYRPSVVSAFADVQVEPVWRLQIRPGLRVEHVGGGRDQTTVSPRVAAKVFLTRSLAVTGSAGRYFQAIHSIRDQEIPLTIFDFWIGADAVTPVARSDHIVGGIEQWFGESWALSVEGYYKTFDSLVIQNFRDDPKLKGDEFDPADGWARGLDVHLRKHRGRLTGWIAYSYGRTIRRTAADTFPPAHDRRHTLNVVFQAPGPFGGQLGVRYGYGSPLPYTQIEGQWLHRHYNSELHGFDWFDRESVSLEINGARFPYYSRLDVGIRWRKEKWGGVIHPYVQLVNVLNRKNVWVYAFDYDRSPPTRSGLSQLPLFPTVGVEVEW